MKRKKAVRWAELTPEAGSKVQGRKTKAVETGRGEDLPPTDAEWEREAALPEVEEIPAQADDALAQEDTPAGAVTQTAASGEDAAKAGGTAQADDGAAQSGEVTHVPAAGDTASPENAQDPEAVRAAQEQEEQARRCAAMRERAKAAAARSAGSLAGGPARFDPEGDAFRRAFKAALR